VAVNTKADKTGGHRSSGLKAASYSKAPAAPAASGMVPMGAKALGLRAKKVLSPLADPNSPITA
jgi:hypothetical protein